MKNRFRIYWNDMRGRIGRLGIKEMMKSSSRNMSKSSYKGRMKNYYFLFS